MTICHGSTRMVKVPDATACTMLIQCMSCLIGYFQQKTLFLFHVIMGGGCPLAEQWSTMLIIVQQVRCLASNPGMSEGGENATVHACT